MHLVTASVSSRPSAGWTVSEENFLRDNKVISFLKIRGSYGEVGNDKIGGQRYLYPPEAPIHWATAVDQDYVWNAGPDLAVYNIYS